MPKLITVLEKEGLLIEKEGELPYMKAVILLVHKGTIYEICSGFTVIKYKDFQVVGRVSDYAHATLMNTKPMDNIEERIVKALDIVAENSQYVGKPYLLINTKELEYKIVTNDMQYRVAKEV